MKKNKKKKTRCWKGYEPVPGKKPYSDDSCRPVKKKAMTHSQKYAAIKSLYFLNN
tara:strand:- start:154 stop:318 length:165 start_codon:yes stop_codon:yes gene_type:complete